MSQLKSNRRPLWAVLVLVLSVGLWVIYWFTARHWAETEVEKTLSRLEGQGLSLNCETKTWGGFPLTFTITCPRPSFQGLPLGHVTAQHLTLTAPAYYPLHATAVATGPIVLEDRTIVPEQATGDFTARWNGGFSTRVQTPSISLGTLVTAKASEATLDDDGTHLVGRVRASDVDIMVKGQPLAIASVSAEARTDSQVLKAQDPVLWLITQKQPIVIDHFAIDLGTTTVAGQGAVTIDDERKLNGKITTKISDLDGLLIILKQTLKLKNSDVATAKTLLNLIGQQGAGTSKTIDLTLTKGAAYWGPFPIADIPPLE